MESLKLPPKTERAIRWLIATLQGEAGPDHPEFKVPLRHLLFKGGRGSAKSHTVARVIINICVGMCIRVLCTREIQKSIEESVYQTLSDVIDDMGFDGFYDKKKTTIEGQNGSEILFAGLRTQDVNKLKSMENIRVCWVEEAHVISERSIEVLTPTVRADNSVIIYTYNPELEDDPVHATYTLDPQPDVCVVDLNWRDNPWFPKVLEGERDRTYRNDKTRNKTKYNWIWEGKTLPAVEGAIFADEVAKLQEEGRIRPLEYDPKGLVYVIMDLGYGVMTAKLVQKFASTVQVIGYYELYNSTYAELTNGTGEPGAFKGLKKLFPHYRWGKVFMPHDASHRDPKTGKSHKKVMEELGWDVADIEQIGVENYIEAGRGLFNNIYISNSDDTEFGGCKQLLRCLKRWRYQVSDTDTGSKKMHPPMKDEFSHGGETWCYTAVVAEELVNEKPGVSNPYAGFETGGYAA